MLTDEDGAVDHRNSDSDDCDKCLIKMILIILW